MIKILPLLHPNLKMKKFFNAGTINYCKQIIGLFLHLTTTNSYKPIKSLSLTPL